MLSNTKLGRYTYAIGSNLEAARLSGVDVKKWQMLVYVIAGGTAGIGGISYAAIYTTVLPAQGQGFELYAIAAAVIGGTSLAGGIGTIWGTIIGVFIMSVLATGLPSLNLEAHWQTFFTGVIVIGAVLLDMYRNRKAAEVRIETPADLYKASMTEKIAALRNEASLRRSGGDAKAAASVQAQIAAAQKRIEDHLREDEGGGEGGAGPDPGGGTRCGPRVRGDAQARGAFRTGREWSGSPSTVRRAITVRRAEGCRTPESGDQPGAHVPGTKTQEEVSMRFFRRVGLLLVAAVFSLPLVGCKPAKIYIPVISKGFQHQFWQTVKKGAEAAAAQYKVDITFEGPPTEADIQPQVQMLVNDMAKNPSAICLAALDTNSVMDQLNQALQKHIPIIGFDSGVPNAPKGAIYATAATNSYNAAALAADKMFAVIKDKIAAASAAHPVTIIDFNQDATSMSVTHRGKGFRDEMIKLITTDGGKQATDIKVTGNPAYIAPDSPTSGKAIIIDVVVPASPKDTDATNTAHAVLDTGQVRPHPRHLLLERRDSKSDSRRLQRRQLRCPSSIPAWWSSASMPARLRRPPVRNKYFLGSITQDPYQIGFKAVELAVKAIKKQPVADVDTGAKFYDSTNIDNPDIAQLVYD